MLLTKTHNHAKFRGDRLKNALDICYRPIYKAPHHAKFNHDRRNHLGKNRYKIFLHPSIFWLSRWTPWAKGHRSEWWGATTPSSYLQSFVPFRRPLSEISAAKLRRFCCRRDQQKRTHKNTVNDMSPHSMRRQWEIDKSLFKCHVQSLSGKIWWNCGHWILEWVLSFRNSTRNTGCFFLPVNSCQGIFLRPSRHPRFARYISES